MLWEDGWSEIVKTKKQKQKQKQKRERITHLFMKERNKFGGVQLN